jgi:hypothetical protein
MKKTLSAIFAGTFLIGGAPAMAGGGGYHGGGHAVVVNHGYAGGYHGYYGGYRGGYWHGHGGIGPWGAVGIGLGAFAAGAALASPYWWPGYGAAPAVPYTFGYTYPQGPYGPPARYCTNGVQSWWC